MSAPSSGSRRTERWRKIDQLCDRFEQARAQGEPLEIEPLLAEVAPDDRPDLLRGLLELLRELRQQTGQPLTPQEAVRRFGALGSWAMEVLEDLGLAESGNSFFLEVQTGARAGQTVQLTGHSVLRVGRGPNVDLELAGDAQLSRVHFCLEYNPPHAYLTDLRSRNGTYLNDQLANQARLRDGDRIRAGHTCFRVALREHLQPLTEEATRPSMMDSVVPLWTSAAPQPAVPGYELLSELGQGGMGRVYLARRASDGRTVAVKIIIPHAAPRPRTIARFQREMRILGRLDHPNIVRLLESGESGGCLYFVMEHVAGCDAGSAVQGAGPLAAERVVVLGCQLLDALAYAHGEGVIHRDIKPANLLLTQNEGKEILKLADFGLARAYRASAMSGLTLTGELAGTPAFMPPEQVRDLRSVRPPADQYAVAATLYYLLTGAGVYEPEHGRIDLLMRIVDTEPIPLRQPYAGSPLPGRLLEVIRRGLARLPQDRYADVPSMREALASAL